MVFLIWILAFLISTFIIIFHITALKKAEPLISQIGTAESFKKNFFITAYILVLHWSEIMMFGGLYYILVEVTNLGEIVGAETVRDYFYFSAANYTTVGYGDLYPTGDIRIFSGIEALVGLIMIGWTVGFTFNYVTKDQA